MPTILQLNTSPSGPAGQSPPVASEFAASPGAEQRDAALASTLQRIEQLAA